MVNDPNKYKQIVVSMENYYWLRSLGQTSDSFNDVLNGLRQASSNRTKNVQGPKVTSPTAQAPPRPPTSTSTHAGTLEVDSLRHMATTEGNRRVVGGT